MAHLNICVVVVFFGIFTKENFAACPHGYIRKGLGKPDQKLIVQMHNHFRDLVKKGKIPNQPKAAYMKQMKWDNNLALQAQKIAETCNFEHVVVSDGRWQAVGQNLATQFSTALTKEYDWKSAIRDWFNEYKIYKFSNVFSHPAGHYTQMVWADTQFVGCGAVIFENDEFLKYRKLYVCNYGPAGNIIGQYPYKAIRSNNKG